MFKNLGIDEKDHDRIQEIRERTKLPIKVIITQALDCYDVMHPNDPRLDNKKRKK